MSADVIQAVAALGTWAAVLVVLFLEVIRPRLRGPRLELASAGLSQTTVIPQQADSCERAWHRLHVKNTGRSSAIDVEVNIGSFEYDHSDLITEPTLQLASQQALLAEKNLKWSSIDSSIVTIPPQGIRHLDLLIRYPKRSGPLRYSSGVALALFPPPVHSDRDHIPASRFIVGLSLSARDLEPRRFRVEVTIGEPWAGGGTPFAQLEVGSALDDVS